MQDAILIALLSWKTKSINCDAIYNILTSWMTLILAYRYNYLFKQQNMQMKAKHTTEWLDLAKDYSLAGLFERLYSACYWRRSVHSVTSNWHNRQHLTRWITRHWSPSMPKTVLARSTRVATFDWLRSFVTERSQFTAVGTERSETVVCLSGVPKGSVLGPIGPIVRHVCIACWRPHRPA